MSKITLSLLLFIHIGTLHAQTNLLEQLNIKPSNNTQQAAIISKLSLKEEYIYTQMSPSEPRFLSEINRFNSDGQPLKSIIFSPERDTLIIKVFSYDADERLSKIITTDYIARIVDTSTDLFYYNTDGELIKKELLGNKSTPIDMSILAYDNNKHLSNINTTYADNQTDIDSIQYNGDTLVRVISYVLDSKGKFYARGTHKILKFDSAQRLYDIEALNYDKPVYKLRQVFKDNCLNEIVEQIYDSENDLSTAQTIHHTLSYDKRGLLIQLISSNGLVEWHEYK